MRLARSRQAIKPIGNKTLRNVYTAYIIRSPVNDFHFHAEPYFFKPNKSSAPRERKAVIIAAMKRSIFSSLDPKIGQK